MPPELLDFLALIKAGGAALSPFLAYWLWSERSERREAQKEAAQVTRDSTAALVNASNGIDKLSDVVSEMNKTMTQIATVILRTGRG